MANLLAKTFEIFWRRQDNQVVGDHDKCPVCLDALPGAHEHVAEGQVLLDVLVEDFDPKSLAVESDHFGFAHPEIVGNQKSGSLGAAFGNKQKHSPDLGQTDDALGNLEFSLLGNTDSFVSPRSLGQVTDDRLLAVYFQDPIAFDRSDKCPSSFDNRNKDRSARIPTVHQHYHGGANFLAKSVENFLGQLNFAFEFAAGARILGTITPNRPRQPLSGNLQQTSHSALPLDHSVGRMMNAQTFDLFAFSGACGIVDSRHHLRLLIGLFRQKILVGLLKALAFLGRTIEKPLEIVGKSLANLTGDFPCGMKLDKPDQADLVNQKMFDLRFRQNAQETLQNRRCFLREKFSHGFRALLGLVSIGDFGRKPFYLKYLSSFVT